MEAAPRVLERGGRQKLRHMPALDGLRGVAVLGVLAFHAGHLTGGYLGVDLFFVLSGYLITSLLVLEWAATGAVSLPSFWVRRARRLLPALLAVLIAVGIASHWLVEPVSRGQLREEGVATLAYVANWFSIFRGSGYWQHTLLPSWLEHTWSLAIEEQFYLLWPLIVTTTWGLWRRGRHRTAPDEALLRNGVRRLALLAWGGAVASAGLMIVLSLTGASQDRLYLGTDTRAAAILFGAGLACSQYLLGAGRVASDRRAAISATGLAGAAVLAIAWTRLSGTGDHLYRGGLLVCGAAATLVLLDVTTDGASPLKRVLAVAPLRWLGLISYGLYLWHWPVYQYLHRGRFGLSGWTLVGVQVAASIAVAVVSYYALELPVRRGVLGRRASRVALLTTAAVAVLALVVGTRGAIDPTPDVAAGAVGSGYVGAAGAPRLMVIGDSVAFSLGTDGLLPQAQRLGVRVVDRASIGCTIMRDVDDPFSSDIRNCSPGWPAIVKRDRPDVVMVLFGGWMGVLPVNVDGKDVWPCEAPWQQRWSERLTSAVTSLSQTGAKVVLLSAPTSADIRYKSTDPGLFDKRQDCSNRVIAQVGRSLPNAGFVDLGRFVCPTDDKCRVRLDGATLRLDQLHFRLDGAKAISRWLVPRVLAAAGRQPVKPG